LRATLSQDGTTDTCAWGIEMNSTVEIRLERIDQRGAPAAMVATWVMSELLAFSDIDVRLKDPGEITLELAPEESERVRTSLAALLDEPRFARWVIAGLPGSHTNSPPDSGPAHPGAQ
jgi:hypothetical protein